MKRWLVKFEYEREKERFNGHIVVTKNDHCYIRNSVRRKFGKDVIMYGPYEVDRDWET